MPSPNRVLLDSSSTLATQFGPFLLEGFINPDTQTVTAAMSVGSIERASQLLVRIHSKCITSEAFASVQCDCAAQLDLAMQRIQSAGSGLLIYLDQEARGNGTRAKLKIYEAMQRFSMTSSKACETLGYRIDARVYTDAIAILRYYDVTSLQLLTNNPDKVAAVQQAGFEVKREPLIVPPNKHNLAYLQEKQQRFQHDLGILGDAE